MRARLTKSGFSSDDRAFMRVALGLARRGLGRTAPNPTVGCVLVRPDIENRIVGCGWTQPGGRPHAETEALRQAGEAAKDAHAYVTLEPCSHTGQTGPCSDALIAAGVGAVTVATIDPDPRVAGSGVQKLKTAGIDVRTGLLETDARALNAGFFSVKERNRPWVTLKTATTLDGAIASGNGASKWITGETARRRGHLLRAQNDAIVTGIGTAMADNPELTCRLPGLEDRSPIRVVIDPRGELPENSKLIATAGQAPVWLIVAYLAETAKTRLTSAPGVKVIQLSAGKDGHIAPKSILETLAEAGITRVLLEAGAGLSSSFLAADMVDEIAWFRAPSTMGGDGLSALSAIGVTSPDTAPRFRPTETLSLDGDVLERYLRVRNTKDE